MEFGNSKNLYIRRLVFALLIIFTAVFGHARGLIPQINSVSAMVLIPLVVCISMFERSKFGFVFGAFAGILWDSFSITGDGFFSISLAIIGFCAGALVTYQFRNNIVSAFILSGASCSLCIIAYWAIFILFANYEDAYYILYRYYLPSVIYTTAFTLIYYYIIKAVFKLTTNERRRINY